MNLLLQPYARPSKTINDNYLITIAKKFDLLKAVNNSSSKNKPDLSEFLLAHPDGKARIWALGENANSKAVFSKIKIGDLVLFHGDKLIYGYGVISSKTIWLKNDYIWPSGKNWNYIYSLSDFIEIPTGSRVTRDSLRQLFPKVGHLSAFFIDLKNLGISQGDVIQHLQVTTPYKKEKSVVSHSRGPENPPILGERFKDRETIWKAYGGQNQQGAAIFPGENYLNIFSKADGPYPDFINEETGVIEYRGQGLTGAQTLTSGNKLLEDARISKAPVRFWYKPVNGEWIFKSWVIVADRITISENDVKNQKSLRFIWFLAPVESEDPAKWSKDIVLAPVLELPIEEPVGPSSYELLLKNYSKLSKGFADESVGVLTGSKPVRRFKRSRDARALVIARSEFKCEYDKCTGMPPDVDSQGKPILEVDHIVPLSEGGSDRPSNMIAICPNCHRAKTIGLNKKRIAKEFLKIVGNKEQLLNLALN